MKPAQQAWWLATFVLVVVFGALLVAEHLIHYSDWSRYYDGVRRAFSVSLIFVPITLSFYWLVVAKELSIRWWRAVLYAIGNVLVALLGALVIELLGCNVFYGCTLA
jgi:hypothetical protein